MPHFFRNLAKRYISKFYYSAKMIFGRFVDGLDGGNHYESDTTNNNYVYEQKTTDVSNF